MSICQLTRQKSKLVSILGFQAKTKQSLFQLLSDGNLFQKAQQRVMSLFKRCSTMKELEQIHAHVIQTGFDRHRFVVGEIITFCAVSDRGDMDYAVSVFERLGNPDRFLWNTMIRGFGKSSFPERAFEFYERMKEIGVVVDSFTFSFLLKVCGQLGSDLLGKQIHCSIVKHGLEFHIFVRNTLVHMYGMFRDMETACHLFEEIPSPDLVAWNAIIDGHVSCGKCTEALDLFLRMLQTGVQPDEATIVVILSSCSTLGALDFGRWVHYSCIESAGLCNILSVSNALMNMYSKCGAVEEAFGTFSKMKEKNIVSWNTMILGLARHGHAEEALQLFSKMLSEELERPNDSTFLGVLCACSHGGMVDEGRWYFDRMKDYHIRPAMTHYGCMVDILGRAGLVEEAYRLIRSMPMECNAIVWRTLLSACRVHGNIELVERVRKHLLELEPDHSSNYVLLSNMYASIDQWNDTLRVRKLMRDRRVQKAEPGNSFVGVHPHSG